MSISSIINQDLDSELSCHEEGNLDCQAICNVPAISDLLLNPHTGMVPYNPATFAGVRAGDNSKAKDIYSSQINLNAFAIFRTERNREIKANIPEKRSFSDLQRQIGTEWRSKSVEEREEYRARAKRELVPSQKLRNQVLKRKVGVKAFSIFRNGVASSRQDLCFVDIQKLAGRKWKVTSIESRQPYLDQAAAFFQ